MYVMVRAAGTLPQLLNASRFHANDRERVWH